MGGLWMGMGMGMGLEGVCASRGMMVLLLDWEMEVAMHEA